VFFLRKKERQLLLPFFLFVFPSIKSQQIANYVNNGGFEDITQCIGFSNSKLKYWSLVDTNKFTGYKVFNKCLGNTPSYGTDFQWPRSDSGFIAGTFFHTNFPNIRSNLRNKMKTTLSANKTYCVKFYVNIKNASDFGIDGFGAYFGNNTLDTINYCTIPLTYLNPQVQNPNGNVINDTLNWISITGTFVATGNEKYLVLGNFKNDAATNTLAIVPTATAGYCDVLLDDVSCIDIDLPANAGPDLAFVPGNSVYIGRPHDVGIDEACMWYKLPNMVTAIDTAAGLWVSPIVTTTYVVRQEICGNVKWDTVVVHESALGLAELKMKSEGLKIYPQPAQDILKIEFTIDVEDEFNKIVICNSLGQTMREEEIVFKSKVSEINTKEFPNGVYLLNIKGINSQTVSKRFVVNR